jgi:serine/threonine protein kinase
MRCRRGALDTICSNQRICELYRTLYLKDLPTPEQLKMLSDQEIAFLVYLLAQVTLDWDALAEAFKASFGPISPSAIFDQPENLEKILGALSFYAQLRSTYGQRLDSEMARLARLKVAVSPKIQSKYETIEREIQTLRSFSPTNREEESRFLAEFPERLRLIQERVDGFDGEIVKDLADELNVPPILAERLFQGALTNWRDFITVRADGIVQQNHSIKGLKIYFLPGTSVLVADFAGKVIGKGTYKRAKSAARIGGSADVLSEVVRLSTCAKELAEPLSEEEKKWVERQKGKYADDVRFEMRARQVLEKVPNIAGMTEVRYYNQKGELKIRYLMARYDSDLEKRIEGGGSSLPCYRGVLRALRGIHQLGWVHGDLKTANVLTSGDEGYVADFGFFNPHDTSASFKGNPMYWAPETVFRQQWAYDSKMDMFSFGIMLLSAVNPHLYNQWFSDIDALATSVRKEQTPLDGEWERLNKEAQTLSTEKTALEKLPETLAKRQKLRGLEERQRKIIAAQQDNQRGWFALQADYQRKYVELHTKLRQDVLRVASPHCPLIFDLLSYKPEDRPTAEQAEARFIAVR